MLSSERCRGSPRTKRLCPIRTHNWTYHKRLGSTRKRQARLAWLPRFLIDPSDPPCQQRLCFFEVAHNHRARPTKSHCTAVENTTAAHRIHRQYRPDHDRGDQRRGSAQAHPSCTRVSGSRYAFLMHCDYSHADNSADDVSQRR